MHTVECSESTLALESDDDESEVNAARDNGWVWRNGARRPATNTRAPTKRYFHCAAVYVRAGSAAPLSGVDVGLRMSFTVLERDEKAVISWPSACGDSLSPPRRGL